jgi:hypothetical protein
MARPILLGLLVGAVLTPLLVQARQSPPAAQRREQADQVVAVEPAPGRSPTDSPPATQARVQHPQHPAPAGAYAIVHSDSASLYTDAVRRDWKLLQGGGEVTSLFRDQATGENWTGPDSPDFAITVDGAALTSLDFKVESVAARRAPTPSSRPADVGGAQLVFTLDFPLAGLPAGLQLVREYTLYPGSATVEVHSELLNNTPLPIRIGKYSLDELTTPAAGPLEVQAYNGGTDWRDDYRHVTVEPAPGTDDEGEVLRLDAAGRGDGFFMVSQRRGGLMSRAGRDSNGRTWVGVDNARDVFNLGPLATTPPDYNRVGNPAYPAPIRQRDVLPLGSLDLGTAFTGVYHGGAQQAAATFSADFVAHAMPAFPRTIGLNTFHPWGHDPSKMDDANLRPQVVAGKALGLESFMLDDSWQDLAGDWNFNPSRFPDSTGATAADGQPIPDFVNFVHQQGLKLALWMAPLEFNGKSKAYAAHPEWACVPTGDVTAQVSNDPGLGVWDVTNDSFRAYLTAAVDRLIADYGVTEFKFDFVTLVDCLPHDYLDYEDAWVSLVNQFESKHPSVTFEFDETNDQRTFPFESAALGPAWFDNDHTHGSDVATKQLHDLWSYAPWLPTSEAGFGVYDGTLGSGPGQYTASYLMPAAILSHFSFWTDLTKLSPADAAETAWWTAWYQTHRAGLAGMVYEDSPQDPIDGKAGLVLQPWSGDRGYLFVFRQAGGPTQRVAIQGVDPGRRYRLVSVRDGLVLGNFPGSVLRRGIDLVLPAPFSALVVSVTPLASQ